MNTWTDWWQQDLIWGYGQGLAYWTHSYYTGHIKANYCLQSLIGLPNSLSAISFYKFHILKDQQENINVTIICHLATSLSVITYYQLHNTSVTECKYLGVIYNIIRLEIVPAYHNSSKN